MLDKNYKLKNLAFITAFYIVHPVNLLKRLINYSQAEIIVAESPKKELKISIIIVTYNAVDYIKKCLDSLNAHKPPSSEIIVIDNASNKETVEFLKNEEQNGKIDKLHLSNINNYFSGGNNIGAKLASVNSEYLLLLNSDTEIINNDWYKVLFNNAPDKGIISFGKTDIPVTRPDGWCFLIDKQTYFEFGGINEYYKMNWGITELTGKVARAGYTVKCVINPERYIIHYGQRSYGSSKNTLKFNKMSNIDVMNLFESAQVRLLRI